jgi:hypothetical protein
MTSGLLQIAAAAVIGGSILIAPAQAEPLIVLQGGFSYEGDPFGWQLIGNGFSIGGGGSIPIRSPGGGCGFPCPPGTMVNLSSVLGDDLRPDSLADGSATIFGVTYTGLLMGGTLFFDAPTLTLPRTSAGEEEPIFFTAPFSFLGRVVGHEQNSLEPLFQVDLVGQGTVRLRAFFQPEFNNYFVREATYEFAPVAEPATVLLLGVGSAVLGGRRAMASRRRGLGQARP